MKRKVLLALGIGVLTTAILTMIAFFLHSRMLLWQAVLIMDAVPAHNIGTVEEPFYEGTPIHLFAFGFGVLLGVPIYTFIAFVILSLYERRRDSS